MKTIKWFEREFDFNYGAEQFPTILERLKNAPLLYKDFASLPENLLQYKPENKWSIKENIGHLLLLEPLWLKRFHEIREGKTEMSPADLSNSATDEADFNKESLQDILNRFMDMRNETVIFLESLQQEDYLRSSLHPRLRNAMRMIDLMFFVAEHDTHHLQTIQQIINIYGKK